MWVRHEYTEPRIPLKIDKERDDELFSAPDSGFVDVADLCGVNENFYLFIFVTVYSVCRIIKSYLHF